MDSLMLCLSYFFYFLAFPLGMWDLSSSTRDKTHTPSSKSMESWPLDLQGNPLVLSLYCYPPPFPNLGTNAIILYVTFRYWLLLLSIMPLRLIQVCCMHQYLFLPHCIIPIYYRVLLHCTNVPQIVSPFSCWRTFELFLVWDDYDESCYMCSGVCVCVFRFFMNSSFHFISQDWDCWVICLTS